MTRAANLMTMPAVQRTTCVGNLETSQHGNMATWQHCRWSDNISVPRTTGSLLAIQIDTHIYPVLTLEFS